jgi:DNA invertase Pin-like site-specific DNA recombinase
MKIIAYSYTNPLLDSPPDTSLWPYSPELVYQDFGDRSQLQQLLRDCQASPPQLLLLRRVSDFGENITEISKNLQSLEVLDIEIIALEDPDYQLNFAKILQEISKNELSNRLKAGHAHNRLQALPPPGKAPYGYRRGKDRYILDRSTAPVVKDFFDRFLISASLRSTVRYLEKRYGKKISVATAHKWLTNPVYRGDLLYLGQEIIPDTHTPIISREEAAQIDRILRNNRKLPPRSASAPRSLAGLVVCSQCQSGMTITKVTARGKPQEYLYLRPLQCPRPKKCSAIAYEQILQCTIERICQDLPKTIAQISLPDLEAIKGGISREIQQKNDILAQLPQLEAAGILDQETANLRAYKLKNEIAQIQGRLDQLPPDNLTIIARSVAFPQFWQDLSEIERRFYFREFIRRIEIERETGNNWHLRLIFVF